MITGRHYSAPWTTGWAAICANCYRHFDTHMGAKHGRGPWRCRKRSQPRGPQADRVIYDEIADFR